MSRGFTLVELSIVLVIIGLLIGGILVAQSMIGTAKIQSAIRQLQQFDAAVNNFQTKYNALPGDARSFGGNGDGYIYPASRNEWGNFWIDLQNSGFTYNGKRFTATVPGSGIDITSGNPNLPRFELGKNSGVLVTRISEAGAPGVCDTVLGYKNAYVIADFSQVTGWDPSEMNANFSPIPRLDALAVDQKLDDGYTQSGIVQGFNDGSVGSGSGCADASAYIGDDWSNENQPNCYLSVSLQSAPRAPLCIYNP